MTRGSHHWSVLLILALLGVVMGVHGRGAAAVDVAVTFTIPYQPAVVDLNGPAAGTGYATTFIQSQGAVAIVDPANLTVVDLVQGTLASARVTIANRQDGSAESLQAVASGAITSAYDSTTGVLTLTGVASVGSYQTVLRTVVYNDTATPLTTTTRVISVIVNDGVQDSAPAVSTVQMLVNTPGPHVDLNGPLIAGINTSTVIAFDGAPMPIGDPQATVTDAQSTTLTFVQAVISDPVDGASESLDAVVSGSIIMQYDAATATLTLSGTASLAAYQAVVQSLRYSDTAASPHLQPRTITVIASDGVLASPPAVATLTFTSAPTSVSADNAHCGHGTGFTVMIGLLALALRLYAMRIVPERRAVSMNPGVTDETG
jgi:hypothetical protein